MVKRVYMSKDELRNMEILMNNDYVGVIESARWVDFLEEYEVVIGFDSVKEFKQFCSMYGYKTSRVGDKGLLKKTES